MKSRVSYYEVVFVTVIVFLASVVIPVLAAGVLIGLKVKERYMSKQE
jgi:uncharacterized paraquat-inducible protein A